MEPDLQNPYSGRILVVDDEESVVQLLRDWLVAEGYYVRAARCFDEVRRAVEEEPFDLVTLDIMMPEVDGLQVLAWLTEHYPDVGVVMATALGDQTSVLTAMRSGAINYLTKPFNLELVSEEIARAMERQRLIAENKAYQRDLEQQVAAQTKELQEAYAQLQRHVRELEGRDQLVRCQMSGPTLAAAGEEILQVVAQVLDVAQAAIFRPAAGGRLEMVALLKDEKAGLPAVPVASLTAQVFREQQPHYGAGRQAAVPLLYQEERLGVLWVEDLPAEHREEAGNTLWRLGQEAALVLWSAQVAEALASGEVPIDELLHLDEGDE